MLLAGRDSDDYDSEAPEIGRQLHRAEATNDVGKVGRMRITVLGGRVLGSVHAARLAGALRKALSRTGGAAPALEDLLDADRAT